MSGSGTDKTKSGIALTGPVVVLVEPQLGENIGMAARAMGNFGLTRLRIVNPRDGWPNVHARRAASGADHILDHVELFETVEQAVADCTLLFATTARAHDQAKPVVAPEAAAAEMTTAMFPIPSAPSTNIRANCRSTIPAISETISTATASSYAATKAPSKCLTAWICTSPRSCLAAKRRIA